MALEQPPLRAREAVLGQPRDRLEERGAERVVQALDRQAAADGVLSPCADRVAQLRLAAGAAARERRHRARLDAAEGRVRRAGSAAGTSCGTSGAAATRRCAASRPSSRSGGRRRSRPSSRGRTGAAGSPGSGAKRRRRPLPAVAHQVGDAERAVARGMGADRRRDPSAGSRRRRAARDQAPRRPTGGRARRLRACRRPRAGAAPRSAARARATRAYAAASAWLT